MKILSLIIVTLALSSCGHSTLKSPCSPTASLANNPCERIPVNVANLGNKMEKSS